MDLIITSAWRAKSQVTINSIPKTWVHKTYVLVPRDQRADYKKVIPPEFRLIFHDCYGLSPTRQWILDNFELFGRRVCLLDDDLTFARRVDGKLKGATAKDIDEMFHLLEDWMVDGLAQVGISPQAGNNRITADFDEVGRHMRVLGLDLGIVKATGARFDRVVCMSDFDMTLQLLEAGYKNRVSYVFASNQAKSNAPGGCAVYRDRETLRKAAFKLASLHPGVVRPGLKYSKTPWGKFGRIDRVDVTIYWKKAYRPRRREPGGLSRFFPTASNTPF